VKQFKFADRLRLPIVIVEGPDELEARSWSRHGNIDLYLSGAGAPPMGAASGAPGYVTATRFMQDWEAGLVKS